MQCTWPFRNFSSDQLMVELLSAQKDELQNSVRVLRILEEVDRRGLYAELGYPSLYQFCLSVLHLSEHEAYLRMTAARTCRRFVVIFEMLDRAELHLSAVAKLGPHLTEENHRSLLGAATHKTKRQVEEMLAAQFPQPPIAESIRRLPSLSSLPAMTLALVVRFVEKRSNPFPLNATRFASQPARNAVSFLTEPKTS
jgi:hypothetical protein